MNERQLIGKTSARHNFFVLFFLACTFGLRCVHLLVPGHYYLVNPDSFWFHHMAQEIIAGTHVPLTESGLGYPLALAGSIIGLKAASILIPPFLATLVGTFLYIVVSKVYNRNIALLTLIAWALAAESIFAGMAGNLDRDMLCIGLVTIGMFSAYLFLRTMKWEAVTGWIGSMLIISVLWGWIGVALLAGLTLAYTAVEALRDQSTKYAIATCVLLLIVAGATVLFWPNITVSVRGMVSGVAEMEHNPLPGIAKYLLLGIPVAFGIALAWKKPAPIGKFLLVWTGASLLASFLAVRFLVFSLVPVCLLFGVGADYLQQKERRVYLASGAMALLGVFAAFWVPQNASMSNNWVEACRYLRDNSAHNCLVISAWSNGHWVLDVAEREPYVHNALHTPYRDELVYRLYCATEDNVTLPASSYTSCKCKSTYIVFSTREKHYWKSIVRIADYHGEKEDTLYFRALEENFESPCFSVAFRNNETVVLEIRP